MPRCVVNTWVNPESGAQVPIEVEYVTDGDPAGVPLLLVMGFTVPLIQWREGLVRMLVERGHHVIRFDNRDCGLSTKLDAKVDPMAVIAAQAAGQPLPPVPYLLSDMADDGFGLLTHLGIERAHIAGASMGGMIVQTMAINHPERVLSMTSIMSTTGEHRVGRATPEANAVLLRPPATTREEYVARAPDALVWASRRHGDAADLMAHAGRVWDRGVWPAGNARQLAAIVASGSRADALAKLDVPTLVIHGSDDTLIGPSGGVRTAEVVPGAELVMLADMGHDVPEPLWPVVVDAITQHTSGSALPG
jgi:pimeloyl-ACP methyl ester carboxylesterase